MRVVAFAFAILSLGAPMAPADAQNYNRGPYSDDPRSGPPGAYNEGPYSDSEQLPYFTEREPARRPREGFQSPPYRGEPPIREQRYEQGGDDRPGMRPPPYPQNREPPPVRRVEKAPPEAGGPPHRDPRATVWPPVRPGSGPPPTRYTTVQRPERPVERATVSIAEFRELENRVRELERMLEQRDFRDDRRRSERPPQVIYR